jgi:hypothetical protein
MLILFFQAAILLTLAFILFTLTNNGRSLMSLQETVDQLTEKLAIAYGEIVTEIGKLEAQVDAAGVAEQVDFSALQKAADMLDGIVPDEVEPEIAKRDDVDDK